MRPADLIVAAQKGNGSLERWLEGLDLLKKCIPNFRIAFQVDELLHRHLGFSEGGAAHMIEGGAFDDAPFLA